MDRINRDKDRVGYYFTPSNSDLLLNFLRKKILGLNDGKITTVDDLYSRNPNQFPFSECTNYSREDECYFFTWLKPDCKLVTEDGYYSTSKREPIFAYDKITEYLHYVTYNKRFLVGIMRTLTYYEGRPPKGKRTNWIVQECRFHPRAIVPELGLDHTLQEKAKESNLVACRILFLGESKRKEERCELKFGL